MQAIRKKMEEKPWIGWVLAGVLLAAAVYLYISRSSTRSIEYGPDFMTQMVTVKYADTGEEVEMPRGRFEVMLRSVNQGQLDPTKGIINPATNQPTGFLFDKDEWRESVDRINRERAANAANGGAAPGPTTPPPAPK